MKQFTTPFIFSLMLLSLQAKAVETSLPGTPKNVDAPPADDHATKGGKYNPLLDKPKAEIRKVQGEIVDSAITTIGQCKDKKVINSSDGTIAYELKEPLWSGMVKFLEAGGKEEVYSKEQLQNLYARRIAKKPFSQLDPKLQTAIAQIAEAQNYVFTKLAASNTSGAVAKAITANNASYSNRKSMIQVIKTTNKEEYDYLNGTGAGLLQSAEAEIKNWLKTCKMEELGKTEDMQAQVDDDAKQSAEQIAAEAKVKQEAQNKLDKAKVAAYEAASKDVADLAGKDIAGMNADQLKAHEAAIDAKVAELKKIEATPGNLIPRDTNAPLAALEAAKAKIAKQKGTTELGQKLLADGQHKDYDGQPDGFQAGPDGEVLGAVRDANPALFKDVKTFTQEDVERLNKETEIVGKELTTNDKTIADLRSELKADAAAKVDHPDADDPDHGLSDKALAEKQEALKTALEKGEQLKGLQRRADAQNKAYQVSRTHEYETDLSEKSPYSSNDKNPAVTIAGDLELKGTVAKKTTALDKANKEFEAAAAAADSAAPADQANADAALRLARNNRAKAKTDLDAASAAKARIEATDTHIAEAAVLQKSAAVIKAKPKVEYDSDTVHPNTFEVNAEIAKTQDPADPLVEKDADGDWVKISGKSVPEDVLKDAAQKAAALKKADLRAQPGHSAKEFFAEYLHLVSSKSEETNFQRFEADKIKPVISGTFVTGYDLSGLTEEERIRLVNEFGKWMNKGQTDKIELKDLDLE